MSLRLLMFFTLCNPLIILLAAEYIGNTTSSFKARWANHTKSFRHEEYQHETTLSSYVWDNNLNPNPPIKWSLVKKSRKYQSGDKVCQICNDEKYSILKGLHNVNNINKRSDIGTKCHHRRKSTLAYFKTDLKT